MAALQFVIKVIFEIGYIKGARKAPLQIGYFTLNYVGASSARPHILEKHQLFWHSEGPPKAAPTIGSLQLYVRADDIRHYYFLASAALQTSFVHPLQILSYIYITNFSQPAEKP